MSGMEEAPMFVIQINPERVTPRGRTRHADYLARINYPGLLSGQAVTVTVTGNPESAIPYADADAAESAVALLTSIGYEPEVIEVAR